MPLWWDKLSLLITAGVLIVQVSVGIFHGVPDQQHFATFVEDQLQGIRGVALA